MTALTGTKTKTTKTGELHPPKEIRENTKARRAWLSAECERVNAQPNQSAKIVGQGSYQYVSVYSVTQVAGRLRYRGVCQCCGNQQVVSPDRQQVQVLVLHGYQRPGWGSIHGECPGMALPPLNHDATFTTRWLAEAEADLVKRQDELAAAERTETLAMAALYGGNKYDREPGAYQAQPKSPRHFTGQEPKAEDVQAWRAAMKVWRAQYPLTSALVAAKDALSAARNAEWRQRGLVEHFTKLLASGVHGTPLTEEVVA